MLPGCGRLLGPTPPGPRRTDLLSRRSPMSGDTSRLNNAEVPQALRDNHDIYLPPSEVSPDRRPRARGGSRPSGWLALEPGVVRAVAALSVDQSRSTPVQTSSGPRLDGREDFRFCHCRQNAFQLVPGARRIGRPGVQTRRARANIAAAQTAEPSDGGNAENSSSSFSANAIHRAAPLGPGAPGAVPAVSNGPIGADQNAILSAR